MGTGKSLLWILGQSRRWSTRVQPWLVPASHTTAAELQTQLEARSSNMITKIFRPQANEEVKRNMPWALLYHNGHGSQHNQTLQPAQPPSALEYVSTLLQHAELTSKQAACTQ